MLPMIGTASDDESDDILLMIPAMVAGSPPAVDVCHRSDLEGLRSNTPINIVCNVNLNGARVELPVGVVVTKASGTITNGTLVFVRGRIDGQLLSSSLTIVGTPKLLDPVFSFVPERWQKITQGPTNADRAFQNNQELERLFFLIKRYGGTTFKIDRFDAYFQARMTPPDRFVFRPAKEAVNLPSNFTLQMSSRTHLRVYPATPSSELRGGSILAVRDEENIIVRGGNLHGDRDQRYYSPQDDGQEGSHLFTIRSGRNVKISGVRFYEGSSGSLNINSFGFSFNPDYNPTDGVIIENCLFKDSRRMSIALTDGRNVLIRNNRFINNGNDASHSDGGEVGYAINIEPARTRDSNGNLLEYQRVFDTRITGNTEQGSRGGFVTLTIGQRLTVDDNDIGTRVVTSLVSDSKVINNRFTAPANGGNTFAVFVAGGTGPTVFNNEVAGNTIRGYSSGIITSTTDALIRNNTISDVAVGIQFGKSTNTRFIDNVINASSRGVNSTNTYNDNVVLRGNQINGETGFHIYVANVNTAASQASNTITFDDNTTVGDRAIVVSNAAGIKLLNNSLRSGVQVSNTSNTDVSGNTIRPDNFHGIHLSGEINNSTVTNNTVFEPTGLSRYQCLQNDAASSSSNLTISNNSCSN
jgi:parallel beta-helix repeat protein